jgi:hypothetical protein
MITRSYRADLTILANSIELPVPTVKQVLAFTAIGCGRHRWACEGGSIEISSGDLRPLLEDAYDSTCPNWMAFVDTEELESVEDLF